LFIYGLFIYYIFFIVTNKKFVLPCSTWAPGNPARVRSEKKPNWAR